MVIACHKFCTATEKKRKDSIFEQNTGLVKGFSSNYNFIAKLLSESIWAAITKYQRLGSL